MNIKSFCFLIFIVICQKVFNSVLSKRSLVKSALKAITVNNIYNGCSRIVQIQTKSSDFLSADTVNKKLTRVKAPDSNCEFIIERLDTKNYEIRAYDGSHINRSTTGIDLAASGDGIYWGLTGDSSNNVSFLSIIKNDYMMANIGDTLVVPNTSAGSFTLIPIHNAQNNINVLDDLNKCNMKGSIMSSNGKFMARDSSRAIAALSDTKTTWTVWEVVKVSNDNNVMLKSSNGDFLARVNTTSPYVNMAAAGNYGIIWLMGNSADNTLTFKSVRGDYLAFNGTAITLTLQVGTSAQWNVVGS